MIRDLVIELEEFSLTYWSRDESSVHHFCSGPKIPIHQSIIVTYRASYPHEPRQILSWRNERRAVTSVVLFRASYRDERRDVTSLVPWRASCCYERRDVSGVVLLRASCRDECRTVTSTVTLSCDVTSVVAIFHGDTCAVTLFYVRCIIFVLKVFQRSRLWYSFNMMMIWSKVRKTT